MNGQEKIKIFFEYDKSKSGIDDFKNEVFEYIKNKPLNHYFNNEVDEDLQTEVFYKTPLALIDHMFGTVHIFALDCFIIPILTYIEFEKQSQYGDERVYPKDVEIVWMRNESGELSAIQYLPHFKYLDFVKTDLNFESADVAKDIVLHLLNSCKKNYFYALCNSMLETIKYNLIQTINHKTKLIPRWGNDALFGIDKDFRNKLFFTAQKKYMHFPPAEIKRYAIELVIEEMGRLHYAWQKSFSIDSGSHMDYMNKINPLE